ncbi:MAG: glycoside hydrolase family 2 [Clostridia bacterium]|nr:glycoside hydrolase family 2 [Clostridia bacterium]
MIFEPSFINSSIPLAEYPRPQLKRDSYLSLNGEWDYCICKKGEFNGKYEGKIVVPFSPECELSGVKKQLQKDEELHYFSTFTLPDGFMQDKLLLNVGASDQITEVYLNNNLVGKNFGGYLAFSIDLTLYLKDGENQLHLIVTDDADTEIYARGKQKYKRGGIWYTATSGIWQSVWLESVPSDYIRSIKLLPSFNDKTLTITCNSLDTQAVEIVVIGDDGAPLYTINGKTNEAITFKVEDCKPWSVDTPNLYPLIIKTSSDKVESYFGLRTFSTAKIGGKIYPTLNGEPIFHNGLLDQGYFHDGLYTPKDNRTMFEQVKAVKDMGFNMLRKHIKIEPQLWYYYCDILGVLVWQDMINGGAKYKARRIVLAPFINLHLNDTNYKSMGRNLESRRQYYVEAKGLIEQLYNCVSLCVYTPFNECWGQFDALKTCEWVKSLDNTRLVDHASGWQDMGGGDFYSRHIYFRKAKPKNDKKRILALTEFGGYSLAVEGHVFSSKKFGYKKYKDNSSLYSAYESLYYDQVLPLIENEGLSATVYTQLTDVEDEINGLFTFDGVLKLPKEKVYTINQAVYKKFDECVKK